MHTFAIRILCSLSNAEIMRVVGQWCLDNVCNFCPDKKREWRTKRSNWSTGSSGYGSSFYPLSMPIQSWPANNRIEIRRNVNMTWKWCAKQQQQQQQTNKNMWKRKILFPPAFIQNPAAVTNVLPLSLTANTREFPFMAEVFTHGSSLQPNLIISTTFKRIANIHGDR